jgi:cell division protein FtsQ
MQLKYKYWRQFLILIYIIVIFATIAYSELDTDIKRIDIEYVGEKQGLMTPAGINRVLTKIYPDIHSRSKIRIDLNLIEDKLDSVSYIKNSQVFFSSNNRLIVRLEEKKPIARIVGKKAYYLSYSGDILPLSKEHTSRVLVVSGTLNRQFVKEELYKLVFFIINDEFWSAQINQVYVTKEQEFILIPRVGNHKIEFGDIENYKKKFHKLFSLYTEGLKICGWNKYSKINLKYENQIVCTKK